MWRKYRKHSIVVLTIILGLLSANFTTNTFAQTNQLPVGLFLDYYWEYESYIGNFSETLTYRYNFTRWIDYDADLVEIKFNCFSNVTYQPSTSILSEYNHTYVAEFPNSFLELPGLFLWPLWIDVSQVTLGEPYVIGSRNHWVIDYIHLDYDSGYDCYELEYFWGFGDLRNLTYVYYDSFSGMAIIGIIEYINASLPLENQLYGQGIFELVSGNIEEFIPPTPTPTSTTTTTQTSSIWPPRTTTTTSQQFTLPTLDVVILASIVVELVIVWILYTRKKKEV
ncbi:MAG: hypothetical protein ACFFF9_10290 [Candidatus Thorarchaeota archaeon]